MCFEIRIRPLLDEYLSLGVAVVLILVYIANLVYTLVTHRDVFAQAPEPDEPSDPGLPAPWPLSRSLLILAAATAFTAIEAEIVSSTVETTADSTRPNAVLPRRRLARHRRQRG